ncbi:MAG: hypothetical protein COX62_01125 [Deltaproteobacteria bacterium CG_4_10_14_0_2_um_filter_43_8]|nr:MAG: hypothetical protein COV43_04635 [Deltaproteobacteria bacterium CG11_big_fil_rev_8_21_14_0_20_42_23]PJA21906.1 MAG: hypothetical protein COX62_01125 [Deltaproteobacteria bacterium CG_4_10_14_0_2_um_filter_43_8]PJC65062.1 MAG: hypothetical protein CO021_01025 [Deltaproteobacteria bacterium CG_4_9_14_0_2_um_filter_42_21]
MKQTHDSFFFFNDKFYSSQDKLLQTLLTSEGVFETIRYSKSGLAFLQEHLARLFAGESAKTIPSTSALDYQKIILQLIKKNKLQNQILRVRIRSTRVGLGISAEKYEALPESMYHSGISLCVAEHPLKKGDAWIKHNRRDAYNTLYTNALQNDFDECLLLQDGFVQECCTSNILLCKNEKVILPPRDGKRLVGITEQQILKHIELPIVEEKIKWPIPNNVEVFISGSLKGLLPVKEITGEKYPIQKKSALYKLIPLFSPYSS